MLIKKKTISFESRYAILSYNLKITINYFILFSLPLFFFPHYRFQTIFPLLLEEVRADYSDMYVSARLIEPWQQYDRGRHMIDG